MKQRHIPEIWDMIFGQMCEEMNAVLIIFFCLFLVSVELNEWKHWVSQKPLHFFNTLKFYTF